MPDIFFYIEISVEKKRLLCWKRKRQSKAGAKAEFNL